MKEPIVFVLYITFKMPTLFGLWDCNQWDHNQMELPWDFHEFCARPYLWNQLFPCIVKQSEWDDGKTTFVQYCAYKTFDRATIVVIFRKKFYNKFKYNYAWDGDVDLKGMHTINSPTKVVEVNTLIQQHFHVLNTYVMLNYRIDIASISFSFSFPLKLVKVVGNMFFEYEIMAT